MERLWFTHNHSKGQWKPMGEREKKGGRERKMNIVRTESFRTLARQGREGDLRLIHTI